MTPPMNPKDGATEGLEAPYVPTLIEFDEPRRIEYVNADVPTVSKRIDERMDLLLDMESREPIGFRLYLPAQPPAQEGERERIARIVDPRSWNRFDRFPPYAEHIARDQQIAWDISLQPSLAKADLIISGRPPQPAGEGAALIEAQLRALAPSWTPETGPLSIVGPTLHIRAGLNLFDAPTPAQDRAADLERMREALTKAANALTTLIRAWAYAPFPAEAQVMAQMSPPSGPLAVAADAVVAARLAALTTEGR